MKLRVAAVCVIVSLPIPAWAQGGAKNKINLDDLPPAKAVPAPAKPAPGAVDPNRPATKEAVKPSVAKKDEKKKADEMGKIEGMEIARGGGFMGLRVVNGVFQLSFYDAKKKPVAPDVARAALRWSVGYQPGPERTVLTPGGGPNVLTSGKVVRPPHNFKLFIALIKGDGDEAATEGLTVDFRQ